MNRRKNGPAEERGAIGVQQGIVTRQFQQLARAGVDGAAQSVARRIRHEHREGARWHRDFLRMLAKEKIKPTGGITEEWRTRIPARFISRRGRLFADELAQDLYTRGMIAQPYVDNLIDFVEKAMSATRPVRVDPKAVRKEARKLVDANARHAANELVQTTYERCRLPNGGTMPRQKFVKGSPEAKAHMARLRAMVGKRKAPAQVGSVMQRCKRRGCTGEAYGVPSGLCNFHRPAFETRGANPLDAYEERTIAHMAHDGLLSARKYTDPYTDVLMAGKAKGMADVLDHFGSPQARRVARTIKKVATRFPILNRERHRNPAGEAQHWMLIPKGEFYAPRVIGTFDQALDKAVRNAKANKTTYEVWELDPRYQRVAAAYKDLWAIVTKDGLAVSPREGRILRQPNPPMLIMGNPGRNPLTEAEFADIQQTAHYRGKMKHTALAGAYPPHDELLRKFRAGKIKEGDLPVLHQYADQMAEAGRHQGALEALYDTSWEYGPYDETKPGLVRRGNPSRRGPKFRRMKKSSMPRIPKPKYDVTITQTTGKKVVKRKLNPGRPGHVPAHIANDPAFRRELAAYRRRHGSGPIQVRMVRVPKGSPRYMSAWGHIPEVKYDAPRASTKGRRVHHFGERGGKKPWLVSSTSRGPKYLQIVGGNFRAGGRWIYG